MTSEADREIGHGLSEADFQTQRRERSEREAFEFTAIPEAHLRDSRPGAVMRVLCAMW